MTWEDAPDIKREVKKIVSVLELEYIKLSSIHCYRSEGSKARAYARCWGFPKIFQRALKIEPAYVIEVLSRHFDRLNQEEREKVLIHELLHIPKNFSGALLPHQTRQRSLHRSANALFKEYKKRLEDA